MDMTPLWMSHKERKSLKADAGQHLLRPLRVSANAWACSH